MNEQEYARKILAALQDAGLVPHGVEEFKNLPGTGNGWFFAPGPAGWVSVDIRDDGPDKDARYVTVDFRVPKPPISPTAKALREVQA